MDWELTCRVCLEGGDMVSLFDCDENNELLRDKYKYTTDIEVLETDTLPTLICLTCVDRLMFAYQFKQQCVTSNDTLKECLAELHKSSAAIPNSKLNTAGSEMITIKQENGVYLQYELPVEHEGGGRSLSVESPVRRPRGRPRKYPNQRGEISMSPYQRKTQNKKKEEEPSLSEILAGGGITLKEEPDEGSLDFMDDGDHHDDHEDPDYTPGEKPSEEADTAQPPVATKRKRGRPSKKPSRDESQEDVLLKETIMAYSEPLAQEIVQPKPPKERKKYPKKRYTYEKTHTCETCGNSFRSNASLQAHIRRHLGIKPFVCSVCGYSCVLNMELRRHMMRHTGVRPYKCRICDRRFGDFGSRQKHERLHLGERPYQCSLCGKAFTYSYVLSNHMLTHTGEKKYSCAPCNKKFTKAHHLKYHNKVHHKELYLQQQMELEAKRIREQIKISNFPGMLAGHILEGHGVQLLQADGMGDGGELQLQVVESEDGGAAAEREAEAAAEEAGGGAETDGSDAGEVHYAAYVRDQENNQMDLQMDGISVVDEGEEDGEMIVGDIQSDE